jgi:small subunit ribosomal protein S4
MKLFLKGTRCSMAKCPIERGRPAPGMHGQRRTRKPSDYGLQLREKQRLRRFYGLQEDQFRLFFQRVAKRKGVTGVMLLQQLEARLDNVVYRLGFAVSRSAARQLVRHGHVKVDGHKADIPSMTLTPGQVVSVMERTSSKEGAKRGLELTEGREVPTWLTRDPKALEGRVERIPDREEIAPIVDEQLVVELYSK